MNATMNLLMIRLDVLIGLLRTTYEEYYAQDAGLQRGNPQTTQGTLGQLEDQYRQCLAAIEAQAAQDATTPAGVMQ